ncbi:hypothetical protein [Vibrio profundi]|uniref:hypothetical protein n=1 Tax=Vibrio profundi TaxID=1774960 RepID=UPI0037350A20
MKNKCVRRLKTRCVEEDIRGYEQHKRFLGIRERSISENSERIRKVLKLTDKHIYKWSNRDALYIYYRIYKIPVNASKNKLLRGIDGKEIVDIGEKYKLRTISDETAKKYIQSIKSFTNWLVQSNRINKNPFIGLIPKRTKVKKELKRHKYDQSQINKIFSDELFFNEDFFNSHKYWIPILAIELGMRQNEIAQLYKRDITLVDDIWCLSINDDSDDKSVKNEYSVRLIPLTKNIIRLGFISFISNKNDRLFTELNYGRAGYATSVTKWYSYKSNKWGFGKKTYVSFVQALLYR